MANAEKIISEFERWIGWMDEDCPQIAIDALALMKQRKQEYDQIQELASGHGITLCKDCAHKSRATPTKVNGQYHYWCMRKSHSITDYFFCAYGTPKDGETT